jgi:RNA polymerase primary sigma factor
MGMRQLKISKSITNRDSDSLERYLQEINRTELITPEEEVRLFSLIKRGDSIAKEKLIKANLRFVISVAKQYQGQGISLSDLINEGNVGLIRAVAKFDDTRGFKFISFAVWWIRQSIIQALAQDARIIRLPLNKVVLRRRIQKAGSLLEQELGRSPSDEELAEVMHLKTSEIGAHLSMNDRHVSLDTPLSEGEDNTLLDTLENKNADSTDDSLLHTESLGFEIRRSLTLLNTRQQQTIKYCFGIGIDRALTLEEIGEKFDLTVERVRQIRDKAIMILRTKCNFEQLRSFLRA